jgi:hypothetical protein
MKDESAKDRIQPVDEVRLLRAATCDWRLARGDIGVLAVVLKHADASWLSFPGTRLIAEQARLATSNVMASIEKLERYGYLRVTRRGQRKRQDYQVLMSPEVVESAPARKSSGFGKSAPARKSSSGVPSAPVDRISSAPVDRKKLLLCTGAQCTSEDTIEVTETESTREKPSAVILPNWIPADAWQAWKDHRKQVGRKFTDQAQRLAIRRLDALRTEGHDPRKLIDLAIESGWSSFNPRRDRTLANPKGFDTVGTIERDARTDEEIERENAEQLARFGLKDAA